MIVQVIIGVDIPMRVHTGVRYTEIKDGVYRLYFGKGSINDWVPTSCVIYSLKTILEVREEITNGSDFI